MIKSVTVTNYLGESVKIVLTEAEPDHGLLITNIDGLGPVGADINRTEIATNDGDLYNSARRKGRNIVMQLQFEGSDIEAIRHLTYKYFPEKKYTTIVVEADHRICEAYGYIESNNPTIFSEKEGCQVSIICPDPNFYSAGEDGNNVTTFFGVEPLFEFPFDNNSLEEDLIEFGSIENKTEQTIVYDGDANVGILIRIHAVGSVGDITIYNTGTREIMKLDMAKLEALTGDTLIAGDELIISTVRGNKYISLLRNGQYTNVLNILDKNSDWFELAKGDNVFVYVAEYGTTNVQFKIENRTVFEGV